MAEGEADKRAGQQLKPYAFKPGQSGNPAGRPKGSRNKLGEAFIEALHDDFLDNGAATIARVREEDPTAYVKVCASLLPKELKIERVDELNDEQLDQRIRQLASIIGVEIGAADAPGSKTASGETQSAGDVSTLQ
jgi:hypothetical protein